MIFESLIDKNWIFQDCSLIRYNPDKSVVKLKIDDKIRMTAEDFERFSSAFFDELKRNFID